MKTIVKNALRINHTDRQQMSIYISGNQIVDEFDDSEADRIIDATGCIAMTGGVDLHTHIGGGKANLARLLLFERDPAIKTKFASPLFEPLSSPVPPTLETGLRYLQLGYTTCIEPAILPNGARHAHCEMIDTPYVNTGGYLVLGNDEILLHRLSQSADAEEIRDYVAWMLHATSCIGVKVVNAGGISAFKYNQRYMDLDTSHPHWRITPRAILFELARAVDALQLAHPLHVHCSNLGCSGNIASTLATIDAVAGHRLHLTHAQFHCYGNDGPYRYSSAAAQLADRVNCQPELSIDVGQVFFGQTVTLSADIMHQYENRLLARPRKTIFLDSECQAGCGILPFKYRESQFVNALQWAIGLELFLLVSNPWQIFLTTDHPNGAPFTAYPHLIKLLCSYDYRMEIMEQLHPAVKNWCRLAEIRREYTLEEIGIITRAGAARMLGLANRVSLDVGQHADLALFRLQDDLEATFSAAEYVLRDGHIVWEKGQAALDAPRKSLLQTDRVRSLSLPRSFHELWPDYNTVPPGSLQISRDELELHGVGCESVG